MLASVVTCHALGCLQHVPLCTVYLTWPLISCKTTCCLKNLARLRCSRSANVRSMTVKVHFHCRQFGQNFSFVKLLFEAKKNLKFVTVPQQTFRCSQHGECSQCQLIQKKLFEIVKCSFMVLLVDLTLIPYLNIHISLLEHPVEVIV